MLDGAVEWIHQHIKDIEAIKVAQQWELSTVLRVRTTSGDLYFKASIRLPLTADEPRLTALLARLYPAYVPAVLAVDAERGWLIVDDVGENLRTLPRYELWYESLLRLAELQHESAAHLDRLLAAGCNDWRTNRLVGLIDALLADDAALSGLDADEAARLRERAPQFRAACAGLNLTTLVHGDFHGGNIGWKAGALRFFDWTESAIAHPFFDLFVCLNDAGRFFPADEVATLRDAYLQRWGGNPSDQWRLAAPLAALHQAHIYNGVAQRLKPDAPRVRVASWLRKALLEIEG